MDIVRPSPALKKWLVRVRTWTDWSFKFVGWLVVIAALSYAGTAAHEPALTFAAAALRLLVAAVVWLFIADLANFRVPKWGRLFEISVALIVISSSIAAEGLAQDAIGEAIKEILASHVALH